MGFHMKTQIQLSLRGMLELGLGLKVLRFRVVFP